jgi:hypothetical protein
MVCVNTPFTYKSMLSPSIVTATSCHCVGCCARTPAPPSASTASSAKSAARTHDARICGVTQKRSACVETKRHTVLLLGVCVTRLYADAIPLQRVNVDSSNHEDDAPPRRDRMRQLF